MNLETELVEITKDNLAEAQFMASNFIDVSVQNRIFFNVIGSEAIISYLEKLGVDTDGIASIHSIKRIVEKVDIADVILKNIHIDVRVIFNEYEIFVPKSHYDLGIVPDIYAVLKYDKSFQRINFIGFFEPSAIDLNNCNGEYYFIEPEKLKSPFEMVNFINGYNGITDKNITEEQMLRGRELSVAVADHDVTDEEFNEFISLLLKSNSLRNAVLEYDNFETLASRVATALQVSKSNSLAQNEVVDFDDFVNMTDAPVDEVQDTASANEVKDEKPQDLNGDSLLDDVVDGVKFAAGAADTISAVAGAVEDAKVFGANAVSDEAIELAGIAGDVISDAAEELLDDGISDNIETKVSDEVFVQPDDFETNAGVSDDVDLTTREIAQPDEIIANDNNTDILEFSEKTDLSAADESIISAENIDELLITDAPELNDVEDVVMQECEQVALQSDDEQNSDESVNIATDDDIFEDDISDFPDLDLSEDDLTLDEVSNEDASATATDKPVSDIDTESSEELKDADTSNNIENPRDFGDDGDLANLTEQEPVNEVSGERTVENEGDSFDENTQKTESESDDSESEQTSENEDLLFNDEELNLDDFGQDLDLEEFEDFITEEPSESEPAVSEDFKHKEDGAADDISQDDTVIPEQESLIIEPDLSENIQNTDISEDESIDIILKTTEESLMSDEDKDFSNEDTNTENEKLFDIGESLDMQNDEFGDIFASDDTNDFDIGEISEVPTGEVPDEPHNFDSNDLEKHDDDSEVKVDDVSIVDTVADDVTEDVSAGDFESDISNDVDTDNVSDNDEGAKNSDGDIFSDSNDNLEAGDDDLILNDEKSDSEDAFSYENEEFKADLEDISNGIGLELAEYVSEDKSSVSVPSNDNTRDFSEFPTEQVEEHNDSDEYGLVNFSDLADATTPEPYNAEISFADVEDFSNFETVAPIEDNSGIDYFADDYAVDTLLNSDSVKENSFVITDKNHNPGEIFIDINKDSSKVAIFEGNEHLEELYSNNSTVIPEDNGLNDSRVVNEKGKIIPVVLGVGGLALVIMIASIIILSVSKFMNPAPKENEPLVADNTSINNNLGNDVPTVNPDNSNVVMNNNAQSQSSVPQHAGSNANTGQNVQNAAVQQAAKPIPATSFLSVRKLSWEVPDYISVDSNFKQYFQSAGKSLKASLSSDLLLATDYTYSDQIRLSVLYNKDGSFQQSKILLSSGSAQVDNIVLQSVNQTLKVLKAPNSVGNDQSTTVILKIYL
ncbi:hypothetical protein IJ674_08870 [bacterium]|nr:hypothetical protein [bacterium]